MGTTPSASTTSTTDTTFSKARPRSTPPEHDPTAPAAFNQAVVVGRLVSEPDYRSLPSGVVAASFSLTVRVEGEKTTSVPIVWYEPPKRLGVWKVDDTVVVSGATVRRFFRSARGLGSSTEIVVLQAELGRHQAKCRKLLGRSADELATLSSNL